jgi:hypothetical protein
MAKYESGKIYRIVNSEGYYYIGSTTTELRFRLSKFKRDCIDFNNINIYKHFNSCSDIKIELLEDFPCSSKNELIEREKYYIDSVLSDDYCINKQDLDDIETKRAQDLEDDSEDNEKIDGQVYVIYDSNGYFYFGSTKNNLERRLLEHKICGEKHSERKIYKHFNSINWENVNIECIEEIKYKSIKKLHKRENFYINKLLSSKFCLNEIRSYLSKEDRYQQLADYRDSHKEEKKKYRSEHMEEHREYNKNYIVAHKEAVEEKKKEYRETHKEELKEYFKNYAEKHKEEKKEYKRKYAAENKEIIAKKNKEFRESNKDKISEKGKEYFEANRDILIKKMKKYRENNPDKMKVHEAKYIEKRRMKLNEIGTLQCECGGKYTENHKKRHEESKKHARFLGGHLVETKDGQDSSFPQKEQGQSQGDT